MKLLKNVKYGLSSNKCHFFRVNFLINASFEHLSLLEGDVYFTFLFPSVASIVRAAFKRGNTVRFSLYLSG